MPAEMPFESRYAHPRYWPTWLLLGFLRVVALLPLPLIHAIGSGIGRMLYRLARSRRRVCEINICQAYPNYTDTEVNLLCQQTFRSLGISLFETALAWWARRNYLRKISKVSGMEYYEAATTLDRPVIFLTGHFTALDLGGILLALYLPLQAVYKRAHNELFNAVMHDYRNRHLVRALPNTEMRTIMKELKNGTATWYAPDQDFGSKDIVFTPFLGGQASTLTSTARMAQMSDAIVIPFYPKRLPHSEGYELVLLPPLEDFPSGDTMQDAAAVNRIIEHMVYENPEQYAWFHKRFKNQPDGKPSIYS